jgi:hypothetical protein
VEVELVVLVVDGVVWVDDVVLDVVLVVVLVVDDVVLDVVLEVVVEDDVLLEVLLDDVVLLTAAVYTNVATPNALVPSPPQVAFTVNVPVVHAAFPPG